MLKTKLTYESWLLRYSVTMANDMFLARLKTWAYAWLIEEKIATRNLFSPLSLEPLKFLKMSISNVRKSNPILKDSTGTIYANPYFTCTARLRGVEMYFKDSAMGSIERYIRRYVSGFLNNNPATGITLNLTTNYGRGACKLRLSIDTLIALNNPEFFYFIFSLPKIIQMMNTLHRKASFHDGILPATTQEDDIPF